MTFTVIKFGSLNGGEDDEHSDVSLVSTSNIFATYDSFFGKKSFDRR